MMNKMLEIPLYSHQGSFDGRRNWRGERTLNGREFREGEAYPQVTERIRQVFDASL